MSRRASLSRSSRGYHPQRIHPVQQPVGSAVYNTAPIRTGRTPWKASAPRLMLHKYGARMRAAGRVCVNFSNFSSPRAWPCEVLHLTTGRGQGYGQARTMCGACGDRRFDVRESGAFGLPEGNIRHHVWRPNAWLAYSGSARPRRSRLVTMLRRGLGHPVAGGLRYGCWLIHRLRTGGCSVEQKPGTPSVIGDDGFQSLHRWFYNRRGGMRWVEKKSKDRSWGQLEGGCGRG